MKRKSQPNIAQARNFAPVSNLHFVQNFATRKMMTLDQHD